MTLKIKTVLVGDLKPFDRNPKQHPEAQLEKISKSIQTFGWTNPILASQDGMILAGHARHEAAKRLGLKEVPVIYIDLPYEKAIAYVLADNRLAELAETDTEKLASVLSELQELPDFDIELTGFGLDELDSILLKTKDNIEYKLEDFEFENSYDPCWFVVRGRLEDYQEIKGSIESITEKITIEDSIDGQYKP